MTPDTYPTGSLPVKVNDNPQPDTWVEFGYGLAFYDGEVRKRLTRPPIKSSFPEEYRDMVYELLDIWYGKLFRNRLKRKYYEGKNALKDFGISTPPELLGASTTVGWPQKAVDALAVRSRFDGFTAEDDDIQVMLDKLAERSRVSIKYRQLITSVLIQSCGFATVGVDDDGLSHIDFYSAEDASAVWDDAKGRIGYGIVINDRDRHGYPVEMTMYTDEMAISLWDTDDGYWDFEEEPYSMGRPCMETFTYRPTYRRPFGQSRVSRAVMDITDSAVRAALGGDISFQFAVAPQKYMLGADKDIFATKTRWETYIGNIIAIGYNNPDGVMPQFGQLPQASMEQSISWLRALAARFAGETNVPLHMLGVVTDNPSSAEAIYAASEPLIIECQDLNDGSRDSLKSLALMCIAAERNKPLDELTDEERDITVNFVNPAMPSIVSQADAMVKIAGVVPEFAGTDTFFEQVGMSEDVRKKAISEMRRKKAAMDLAEALEKENEEPMVALGANALRGQQMQAIVTLLGQYSSGKISKEQAINTLSAIGGITKAQAESIVLGDASAASVIAESNEEVVDELVQKEG